MKIIKISNQNGSFCSSEVKFASKKIKEQLVQALRGKSENKFVIEIFDISDEDYYLGSRVTKK